MNLVPFIHHHRRAFFTVLFLLLAGGTYASFVSSRSIYPQVAFPRIAIIAERGEEPVRAMLVAVTRPMEEAVGAVPGLVRVRSKTVRGASELSLDFQSGTDMQEALSLVRARAAQASVPSDVTLIIERQTPAVFPVLSFNILPGAAQKNDAVARARLAEWVELDLKSRLARLPDIFTVTVQSGDRREIVFEADPLALARAGVGLLEVRDALAGANRYAAIGRSETEGLQYQLVIDGRIETSEDILKVSVPRSNAAPVLLADLGRVIETVAERTMVVTGGGQDGIVVSCFLRDGGKVTDLSRDVAAVLMDLSSAVPGGGTIDPVYDQAILVEDSITGVRDAILIGALLSVLVLALFLGNWQATLVAGLAIPLSVTLTLAAFPLLGESLNLMSLGGLAVAIGLIIDDAIVVVENVSRRLQRHTTAPSPRSIFEAVSEGTSEVFGAIVGSSLTTVVVFLPLVLLEGVVGQFFRSLCIALGLSVLASMVVSLVYTPLMLLLPGLTPRGVIPSRRWMTGLQNVYASISRRMLHRAALVGVGLIVLLFVGASRLKSLETGFLPAMDEGGFVLDYALPVGSSLKETDAVCRKIEAILNATPEIASLSRRTGAELGFFATEQFTGDMLVGLRPRSERKRSVFEVIDELRERVAHDVPQVEVEFIQVMQDTIADLAGNPAPIEIKVLGNDYPTLQSAADIVEQKISAIGGVVDVKNHVSFGSPDLVWKPDPLRAARIGLSAESIAAQTSAQLLGDVATRIQQDDRLVDIRVRYPDRWRADATTEGTGPPLFLRPAASDSDEQLVPLASIATFSRQISENELERENQVPMVRVTASVAGRDLGSTSREIERVLHSLPKNPAIRYELAGQIESQRDAFSRMLLVFGLGAGLVFLLLVVQFRSFVLPFVMFLALPFGQLGGLLALKVTGIPLDISSGMGLIMLVGLVVKNGIIMIEYAQELCRQGQSELEAIIEAARVRLRPILMTTLTAIAGLLPLALGIGAGAELQRPLAVVVIGGLLVSTVCSLIVVPVGCATLARGRLLPETHHVS